MNAREKMTTSGEADRRVRKAEPGDIVFGQIGNDLCQERHFWFRYDEAIGYSRRVGSWRNKVKGTQWRERAKTQEVKVEEDTCCGLSVNKAVL